jgi:hypothetical protein
MAKKLGVLFIKTNARMKTGGGHLLMYYPFGKNSDIAMDDKV